MKEIKFEIIKKIAIISEKGEKSLQLNYVSWNGREGKLDLRNWGKDYERPLKGVTLSKSEAMRLKEILNKINIDEIFECENVDKKNKTIHKSSEIEILEKYEAELNI